LADHFRSGKSEQALGGAVPRGHDPIECLADNGIF
jgi:hypothetical protein